MKWICKFLYLSWKDRYFLVKSALLLGMIRLGLRLLPFKTLRRFLAKMTRSITRLQGAEQIPIDKVIWAVTLASRYVPKTTCLTQAMVVQMLLVRRGHPAHLRIGVARGEARQFEAHAWVECQGKIVIGGSRDSTGYAPLSSLDEEAP